MINYFQKFIDEKNMTVYSLDMLRLRVIFGSKQTLQEFINYVSALDTFQTENYVIDHKTSFKPFTFKHHFTITTANKHSFAMELEFLGTEEDGLKGWIEFNPNKLCDDDLFRPFYRVLVNKTIIREVVRYDMAIDIPLGRSVCSLMRQNKKTYTLIQGEEGITEYLGSRSTNGYIKLYDKKSESKLDYDVTRLEITLNKKHDIDNIFPEVMIYDTQNALIMGDDLSITDKVLIGMLQTSDKPMFYFSQLSYRMRKKIKPYMAHRTLPLNRKCYEQVKQLALSFETTIT